MKQNVLSITSLRASTGEKEILKGVNLQIKNGEVHAIMGPNGAGKTTLAMSIMGHPSYQLAHKSSKLTIDGEDISNSLPEERARKGLFVSFQHPVEVTGVSVLSFLRTAYKELHPDKKIPLTEFKKKVKGALKQVSLSEDFMKRSLNENFSGGEKKRVEVAQMLILEPSFVVLDEIDSGLDIDSLRIVAQTVQKAVKKQKMGVLVITHYQRILHYVKPDFVHVLIDGKIKKSGNMDLVKKIERNGYAAI